MSGPGAAWTARFAVLMLAAAIWLAAGSRFVGGVWIVAGPSMHPTLRPGQWVLVDRWTLRHRPPRRGELVLLRLPGDSGSAAVKRVHAVSADGRRVEVRGDNPARSRDSREFGPLPRTALLGRVVGYGAAVEGSTPPGR